MHEGLNHLLEKAAHTITDSFIHYIDFKSIRIINKFVAKLPKLSIKALVARRRNRISEQPITSKFLDDGFI